MSSTSPTWARTAMEQLIAIHGLTCMGVAADIRVQPQHFEAALRWLPKLEQTIAGLRRELEQNLAGEQHRLDGLTERNKCLP